MLLTELELALRCQQKILHLNVSIAELVPYSG